MSKQLPGTVVAHVTRALAVVVFRTEEGSLDTFDIHDHNLLRAVKEGTAEECRWMREFILLENLGATSFDDGSDGFLEQHFKAQGGR